jgi:hypothetical protein
MALIDIPTSGAAAVSSRILRLLEVCSRIGGDDERTEALSAKIEAPGRRTLARLRYAVTIRLLNCGWLSTPIRSSNSFLLYSILWFG